MNIHMRTTLRLILGTLLLFLFIPTTNAQYTYNDHKVVTFGVRAGGLVTAYNAKLNPSNLASMNSKFGFVGGVTVDFAFTENVYILTGVDFASKGAVEHRKGQKHEIGASFLTMPIHFGYKVKIEDNPVLITRVGPYMGYGLGGTNKNTVTGEKVDTFQKDGYKKFDYGVGFGVGTEIPMEQGCIVVELGYNLGLADMSEIGEKVKIRDFNFTVGYKF